MERYKRCVGCIRPVCQRIIYLKSCPNKKPQDITGEMLNEYKMYDFFCSA